MTIAISIHAPYTGSDLNAAIAKAIAAIFQSTLPIQGATMTKGVKGYSKAISIHAPYTGSD